jgi:hypothetical protein
MRTLLTNFLVICSLAATGQSTIPDKNFVLNPDFEQKTQCPTQWSDNITLATHWSGVDSAGQGTCIPEYRNACVGSGSVGVPLSSSYYQYPRSGDGFAQTQMFFDESDPSFWKRDYLQGRLYQPLVSGKTYCVAFHVCLAEASQYAIANISAFLDDGTIDTTSECFNPQIQYTPQIYNNTGIITDSVNWTKIKGTFTASGHEQFITIGNFQNLANTTYQDVSTVWGSGTHFTWYLVDDVSVIESDLPALARASDTFMVEGDSVFMGRSKEVGLECKWFANGVQIAETGAGFWVSPSITTTYVVEQTLCDYVTRDTARVEVWPLSAGNVFKDRTLSIFPNPSTKEIIVTIKELKYNHFVITDNMGRLILSGDVESKETRIDVGEFSKGVYNITLVGPNGREIRKFVKI